jgi:hypothetical protein
MNAIPYLAHEDGQGYVEGHGGGEDQGVLMASLTTIYKNKNSHSHMIKSHDWLKQNIRTQLSA